MSELPDPVEEREPESDLGHPTGLRDPEYRRVLLESVSAWLDELGEAEPAVAGLGPEAISSLDQGPDLYSLLAQLAALTRETQLQGRATNRLHAELGPALQRLAESVVGPDVVARKLAEARREARLELVGELLEVRDRFARGLEEARRRLSGLRGLRARFGQRPVLESLAEGNGLALERLDDALRRLDVHEIPSQGKSFDPRMMRAVAVEAASAAPPGTVLEVFRAGYTADGRVLRFAEVKVAGQPPAAGEDPMADVIVGIDLGTTNSEAAALVDGNVQVLAADGEQIMPSFVGLSPEGTPLVGTPARNQYVVYPERTVKSIKRLMGTGESVSMGQLTYSPPEISAMILRELKARAEASLGAPVRRAVITVPAYFSDAQRQATRDAGEIAGLEVVRILNEPTAAALAYGSDREGDRTVLVYDLGGGTFDVSLVQVSGEVTEVLASHGNNRLGGDDFDQLFLDLILARFVAAGGPDVRADRRAMSRLLRAAEEAKKRLSFEPYTRVREEHLAVRDGVPVHLDLEVSREEYERLIRHLVESTLDSVHRALADAGKQPDQVDEILLVGGATRTPLVSELLRDKTGLAPRQEVHPDLCVALGAGVLAARLAGHDVDRVLVDISPYSFGPSYYGFLDGRPSEHCYHPVIARNTPLPASRTDSYVTMVDNQEAWQVSVYQGDDPNALNNVLVGRFLIEGLSAVPAGNEVLCRMDLDLDGILRVTATEKRSGLAKHITIEGATTAMTEGQVAEARRRMQELFGDGEADLDADAGDEIDLDEDADFGEAESDPSSAPAGRRADELEHGRRSDAGERFPGPEAGGERERRVSISEARALLERGQRLLDRMSPEDREETLTLGQAIEKAISGGDWDRLRSATADLADLLFYVEEG